MDSTTPDIILTVLFLLGMALFGLAMLGVCLRWGPRRGYWNQPAAILRRPGNRLFLAVYGMAGVQLLGGIYVALNFSGGGGVLVVACLTALFYVLCAHSWSIAHSVVRRHER